MNELQTWPVQCPYCGETIEVLIDCSIEEQRYIEDCQVCCRPINFHVMVSDGSEVNIVVTDENQ